MPAPNRHVAVYRWLLGLYPRAYRREVGDAAVSTFRDLVRGASRDGGRWGLARLWMSTVPVLVAGGLGDRIRELVTPGETHVGDESAPPYGWAMLSAVAVLALYVSTLAPTTAFWDTSEYVATAHILGIPHPPGNPLFVVLARTWEVLLAPLGLSVAVRINLFSAFVSAAAHGLWFLVVHQILGAFDMRRTFRVVGAFAAVLVSATAFTVWNQSNVNEKVYTVSLLTIALLSWLALRWRAEPDGPKAGNLLALMAFVLGLSVGNHLMAFLAAPAILVFVWVVRPRALLRWRLYPVVIAAGMVGLTIHLFLPIRAEMGPVINQGAPLCDSVRSALGSVLSYGRAGCEALSASLNREQYQKPPVWERQAPIGVQVLHYLQYFDWQWARSVDGARSLLAGARLPFTALFAALGIWGAMEHRRRDRETFWYVLVLFATLSAALTFYLNFEYGYSLPAPEDVRVEREVRERDYFFIASFSVWGLWAGMGIAATWLWLSQRVTGGLARTAPVLLVACLPLAFNGPWADRSYDYAARDWAYNLLQSVEPYGVLFTAGDNDTFPLWYLQETEGIRRDVTIIVTSYLRVPWYAKQLRDLTRPCPERTSADTDPTVIVCQRAYEPGPFVAYVAADKPVEPGAVQLAMSSPPTTPSLPIMRLDDDVIDRIGGSYFSVQEPLTLELGPLRPVVPGEQILQPWQQYALAIVDTAFADTRPVYWSNAGPDPTSLGLDPYLVRQGVAYKVDPQVGARAGVTQVSADESLIGGTGRWVDVPRTTALLDEVFIHRSGLPDWDHWPDASTTNIPAYYGWAYYALALSSSDHEAAQRYADLGQDWMGLVR